MGTMLGRSSRTTSPALTLTLDTYLSLVWPPTSNRAFLSAHGSLLGVSGWEVRAVSVSQETSLPRLVPARPGVQTHDAGPAGGACICASES